MAEMAVILSALFEALRAEVDLEPTQDLIHQRRQDKNKRMNRPEK